MELEVIKKVAHSLDAHLEDVLKTGEIALADYSTSLWQQLEQFTIVAKLGRI